MLRYSRHLLLAFLFVLVTLSWTTRAVSCDLCTKRGYPYVCKVPMTSSTCFSLSGDAHCNSDIGCVCCRLEYADGCKRCEVVDDAFDDDEELLANDYNYDDDDDL